MQKYYDIIKNSTTLNRKIGESAVIPSDFRNLSSVIISNCSFSQSLIQQAIYTSHGSELLGAKKSLKEFANPKARIDFLCSFPYNDPDPVISKVFDFSRNIFKEVYEFRNVLCHEIWSSSDNYAESILFSTLDDESRLLMSQGKVWHIEETSPKEVHEAALRFISRVKIVSYKHLNQAIKDINLCNWCLMHINTILNLEDKKKKEEAKKAFFVFGGTSHLFEDVQESSSLVDFSSSKSKKIT